MKVIDIMRDHIAAYSRSYPVSFHEKKVIDAMTSCRTPVLGTHLEHCELCGHEVEYYNSCGNRHCPTCGNRAKEKWVLSRQKLLLPVVHFHVVLTLPDTINPLALQNKREIYQILFRSGSETLMELGHDPRHLGAEIGVIAMLHTWGQNLVDHPHLHCIVTGGGLKQEKNRWIHAKKKKNGSPFFVHVDVISDLFKKKFIAYLQESYEKKKLAFFGRIDHLNSEKNFKDFTNSLYKKKWVTYCKDAIQNSEKVIDYLGRYAYRVAISNRRILNMENGKVTFQYKDYKDNQTKKMKLDAVEFIRRFLLHILPEGFFKIRYYGIFANRNLKIKLKKCQELLKPTDNDRCISWNQLFYEITGKTLKLCPVCRIGIFITYVLIHSPP